MPTFYPYLMSSLPMLNWLGSPPFSYERLVEICRGMVRGKDLALLQNLPFNITEPGRAAVRSKGVVGKWLSFDTALRNELAKARAHRRRIEPALFLRQDGEPDVSITHIAMAAYRNPSLLEAEKQIDQARWQFLDELAAGHYFDRGALFVYAYKLRILLRWDNVRKADKPVLMEQALKTG